jgi:hypothetical protein
MPRIIAAIFRTFDSDAHFDALLMTPTVVENRACIVAFNSPDNPQITCSTLCKASREAYGQDDESLDPAIVFFCISMKLTLMSAAVMRRNSNYLCSAAARYPLQANDDNLMMKSIT